MYKLVLVDDEILTREAVAANTPWHETGFELAGTAENGQKALELIAKVQPDLLITDICMPIMDGLALSGYVQQHYPDMKVLILSGYDDFNYAKQALKYGVSEYMLKPVTAHELTEELTRICQQLEEERQKRERIASIRKAYEENLPLLKEHFLNRLLSGDIYEEQVTDELHKMGIDLHGQAQAVVLIGTPDPADWEHEHPDISVSLMNFIFYNVSDELLQGQPDVLLFRNINDHCVLIIARDSQRQLLEDAVAIGEAIRGALNQYLNINICITVGVTVHTPTQWKTSYENARYTEEFRYLFESGGILFGKDFINGQSADIQTDGWSERLVSQIKTGQTEAICQTVTQLFAMLHHARCEKKELQLHIQNCVLSIQITLNKWKTVTAIDLEQATAFIKDLDHYRHLSEIEAEFTTFCLTAADMIARQRDCSNHSIAIQAEAYLNEHYMDPDLSLNMLCDYLNLSVSYFCMVFKNNTGETFVEALTRIRMDKAKDLLAFTNARSCEVAAKVGYNDPHYFGAIFKKQTGMTPMEYARHSRETEDKYQHES